MHLLHLQMTISLSFIFIKDRLIAGATGRTRTADLLITNQLLYQLSHSSISFFHLIKVQLNIDDFNSI